MKELLKLTWIQQSCRTWDQYVETVFLYTSNNQSENETKKIPFIIY